MTDLISIQIEEKIKLKVMFHGSNHDVVDDVVNEEDEEKHNLVIKNKVFFFLICQVRIGFFFF